MNTLDNSSARDPMTRAQTIAALQARGCSQRQIARQVGLSQPGVRKALLRLGLLADNHKTVRSVITLPPDTLAASCAMASDNAPLTTQEPAPA